MVSAIIARLGSPELNLAAFGSVADTIRQLTSAPMIMLLSASTALSRDIISYQKISRFMLAAAGVMTTLHFLLAFTPLYFVVVRGILGVPEDIIPIARTGLMIMIPLPWAIGYRRFQQGVMIRNGYSRAVVVGTFVRLGTVMITLVIGYTIGIFSGVIVAATALTAGMTAEALYSGWRVQSILKLLPRESKSETELTWRSFLTFYFPLVLTSLLSMVWRPIGSAAISRMPEAIASLAVWPVIGGLLFLFQTLGISFNEVVLALLDQPGSYKTLRKFAIILCSFISVLFLLVVMTPLSHLWFARVSALPEHLLTLANQAIWLVLPVPGMAVFMSWFQGAILYSRKTRSITEAVAIFLVAIVLIMGAGIAFSNYPGIYIGMAGFTFALCCQFGWLGYRAFPVIKAVQRRDLV